MPTSRESVLLESETYKRKKGFHKEKGKRERKKKGRRKEENRNLAVINITETPIRQRASAYRDEKGRTPHLPKRHRRYQIKKKSRYAVPLLSRGFKIKGQRPKTTPSLPSKNLSQKNNKGKTPSKKKRGESPAGFAVEKKKLSR